MGQIEEICDRSIWIHEGLIRTEGIPRKVHKEYLTYMGEIRKGKISVLNNIASTQESVDNEEETVQENKQADENMKDGNHRGTGEAKILCIETRNKRGEKVEVFSTDEPITFRVHYEVYEEVQNALFGLSIFRNDGIRCYGSNSRADGIPTFTLKNSGYFEIEFTNNQLLQGKYYVDVCIAVGIDDMVDYFDTVCNFEVYSLYEDIGTIRMEHKWRINVGE